MTPPTAPKGGSSISGTPYLADPDFTLYNGDALEVLRSLPDESVHCCVTSPPYWGLRDYGAEGQLGLEPTPDAYVAKMVEVFREVRRVLRKDGTCWLNIGDSYAGGGRGGHSDGINGTPPQGVGNGYPASYRGMKPKDLCMIPARLALALQADGWWLRSEITWCKPNAMPESVTDRPTQATEKVYLLTRSPRYYFDAEAIRRPHQHDGRSVTRVVGQDGSLQHRDGERWPGTGANERNWWLIPTEPFPEAHFATYPQELVRRCILAGTSERGCCPECEAPWVREVVRGESTWAERKKNGAPGHYGYSSAESAHVGAASVTTIGWGPSCECGYPSYVGSELPDPPWSYGPCTVLDPFVGSGTTALVARKHGRKCIGIELSADYCVLAAKRTAQLSLEAEAV